MSAPRVCRPPGRSRKSKRCTPSATFDEASLLTGFPTASLTNFTCEPDPGNPGWFRWKMEDTTRFNEAVLGRQIARAEGPDRCRLRMFPQRHHTNSANNIHGAVTLGLIDVSMFTAMYILRGIDAGKSVTVDMTTQFIGAGDPSKPLDSVVEVLRETGRMVFLRGLVVQDDVVVASFGGTTRKPSTRS